MQSSLAHI